MKNFWSCLNRAQRCTRGLCIWGCLGFLLWPFSNQNSYLRIWPRKTCWKYLSISFKRLNIVLLFYLPALNKGSWNVLVFFITLERFIFWFMKFIDPLKSINQLDSEAKLSIHQKMLLTLVMACVPPSMFNTKTRKIMFENIF